MEGGANRWDREPSEEGLATSCRSAIRMGLLLDPYGLPCYMLRPKVMIDYERKLLFIHIPKTGGNSVNRVFGVSWEDHKDLERYAHEVSRPVVDEYFKFAIVRNPWDRLFSDYNYQCRKSRGEHLHLYGANGKKRKFEDWVKAVFDEPFAYEASVWGGSVSPGIHRWSPQVDWMSLDGEVQVNFVAQLERIDEDFPRLCEAVSIPPQKLPKRNSRFHFNYRRYYTDRLAEVVGNYYRKDIEAFGYTFDPRKSPERGGRIPVAEKLVTRSATEEG